MFPIYDPVCVLLETPFSQWTDKDQKDFLTSDKPIPYLNVHKLTKIKNKVYHRNFKKSWYVEFEWLCGSFYLNKLFCLSCIVMGNKSSTWNQIGFNDFGNVARALNKHEGALEHIRCALQFAKMRKTFIVVEDPVQENSRLYLKHFNDNVRLNRHFMELPIRAVLYLCKQQLAFKSHHEDEPLISGGNFQELLEALISVSPVDIQEHYKKIKPTFSSDSKFQDELIACVAQYIDEYIDRELKPHDLFSIETDDFTDVFQKPQSSIIIRYINGKNRLIEHFLGFYDVSSASSAETFFTISSRPVFKEFLNKCIAQCYDGSAAMSQIHFKIEQIAPQALIVHCVAHHLSFISQQSCSSILKCRLFFAIVSGLSSFFRHCDKLLPASIIAEWTSESKIMETLNTEWESMKQVFGDIMNNPISEKDLIRQSQAFLSDFHDLEFAFLVSVFYSIFQITDQLHNTLQNNSTEIEICSSEIKSSLGILKGKRNKGTFSEIFDLARLKTDNAEKFESREEYKELYYEIIDNVSSELTSRFKNFDKLLFVMLIDTSKFRAYSTNFPGAAFSTVMVCYPNVFNDLHRLRNELQLIYSNEQFWDVDIQDLVNMLAENNTIFKESCKLCWIILTLPCTKYFAGGGSCLRRIQSYLRDNNSKEVCPNLSKICIEYDLLSELIVDRPFYDDIIDKFAILKDREMNLIFRN